MPKNAAPMTSPTRLTMVIDELTLMAPEVLVDLAAEVVALAVPVEVAEAALEVVMPVATGVVVATTAAEVEAATAPVAAPEISLSTVALKVPVMPARVNLAENAVKGNVGVAGSL